MSNKIFDSANPNLWAQVLIAVLGLFSAAGVNWDAATLGDSIFVTITSGSYFSLLTIAATSVLMPIWNWIRSDKLTLKEFIGKPNTLVYLITLVLALLALLGINTTPNAAGEIVRLIQAQDWGSLIGLIFTSILSPLFRYLLDKVRNKNDIPTGV